MTSSHPTTFILLPGYWLGAWAYDELAALLRGAGHSVLALSLPGLEGPTDSRAAVTFGDHVAAVHEAVRSAAAPVVVVAHSGSGAVLSGALDEDPTGISRVIYLDSGPAADGFLPRPDMVGHTELPFPGLGALREAGSSLDGLTDAQLERFVQRAVPHPAGAINTPILLAHPLRDRVPTSLICCSFPAALVQSLVAAGEPLFAAIADLTDLRWVDLPTGHWPMWSLPAEVAATLLAEARIPARR